MSGRKKKLERWAEEDVDKARTERAIARLTNQVSDLKKSLKLRDAEVELAEERVDFMSAIQDIKRVRAIKPRKRRGDAEATAVLLASDWHIGELVDPKTVNGRNRYTPTIATKRAENYFRNGLRLIQSERSSVSIGTAVLWLGGDIITGYIHDELMESNPLSPIEEVLLAQEILTRGIDYLLKEGDLEELVIACSYGNHGRTTQKRRVSTGAKNSYEWLLYQTLARHYAGEDRVTFHIADGAHLYLDIYKTKIRFTHGDDIRYYGGVGGLAIPLRKATDAWSDFRKADITVLGHYHQLSDYGYAIVNGCFAAGTRICVPGGVTPIESVGVGDSVVSKDGTIQTVEALHKQISDGGLITLRAKGLPNFLTCTPNHEIWAIKGESRNGARLSKNATTVLSEKPRWMPAEDVSIGDWIHTPELAGTSEDIDEELAWCYGIYLAEGHALLDGGSTKKHQRIEMTMHIDELPTLGKVKARLDLVFGKEGRTATRPKRTTSTLTYCVPRDTVLQWREWFGHTSHGKRLPPDFFRWSSRLRRALIEGWIEGDGHRGRQLSAVTVSEQLAWGLYQMGVGTGLEPMLYKQNARPSTCKTGKCESFRISFTKGQDVLWVDGERFIRIDYRRRSDDAILVYDLQVSGKHTYVAEGFGVHNSLIGYNAFALSIKARFEEPRQGFFLIDKERGKTVVAPIWVT